MKIIIGVLGILFSVWGASARVLEVRNDFRAGSFASIREAVENASANDTIFLVPKSGSNDPWVAPGFAIDKPLVFIGSNQGRTVISGGLNFNLSHTNEDNLIIKQLEITTIYITNYQYVTNARKKIKIIDCKVDYLDCSYFATEVFSSEIGSASFQFLRLFIGNKFNGSFYLNDRMDSTWIVGNIFTNFYSEANRCLKASKLLFVSNNYVKHQSISGGAYVPFTFSNSISKSIFCNNYVDFKGYKGNYAYGFKSTEYYDSNYSWVLNNVLIMELPHYSGQGFYYFTFEDNLCRNNLLVLPSAAENSPITNLYINGVQFANTAFKNFNQAIGNQKASGGLVIVPDSLGQVFDSTYTINKGIAWPEFSDVDLTRNDIGPSGGPFPISNFWGAGAGKASLYWVDLPWKVLGGNTPIKIKGTAGSK